MEQKTPGVYINEINAFPNSVVGVATAIPVFIGYTEQASYKGESLTGKARRVESMKEFESYFGGAAITKFNLEVVTSTASPTVAKDAEEKDAAADAATGTDAAPAAKALIAPVTLRLSDRNTYALVPTSKVFYLYNSIRLFYQNGGSTCYVISIGDYADAGTPDKQLFFDALETLMYEQEPTMIVAPDALLLPEDDYYSVQQQALKGVVKQIG